MSILSAKYANSLIKCCKALYEGANNTTSFAYANILV